MEKPGSGPSHTTVLFTIGFNQHVNIMQRDRIPKLLKITNCGEEETEDDQ
jgi:hypothetical protein